MSDAYIVDTPDKAYILKVYLHNRHSRSNIEAEVSFLNDLHDHDLPVAVPVANNDAAYLNEIGAPEGTRYIVLFDAITGEEPKEANLEHSHSFGLLAGRMHNCADRLAKQYDRRHLDEKYLIEEPLKYIRPYLQHRKRDWEYLRALGSELTAELNGLVPKESPEYGLCHGDLHTGNARFDKDGRLTLFDFDSFGYGWRAIDIGVYHVSYDWLGLSEETRREKDRFWGAFVDGYSAERTLSRNELAAAQLCLPIRHLELMGLTIRYWSPQIGIGWIDDDYFDRHLSWFREWANLYSKT
ncbi:MAG TPA: phosphotransferase [Anaerolineales bacterium]|nr:phosphotransferase [Anaerolineales bacterium]